jgi:hypothetical protein
VELELMNILLVQNRKIVIQLKQSFGLFLFAVLSTANEKKNTSAVFASLR